MKRHAVEFILKMGSAEYTRQVLRELKTELMSSLNELQGGGKVALINLIKQLDEKLDKEDSEH